ncbi:helix-turn-helix domain-containing protein [Catenovulum sp. SM1970]|uniref:helix-turn-helix domain-containing protein n=1 Tax=Marinifaba aquimaris TaxID=2741323 RepID=UPI0015740E99|nr:helix-turn-helix transcriptional regulator [Marinifaba aquimaris]NTS76750.1 helix-turn-helix domain-containing protein [Marinifaba aquimaris]
MKASPDRIKQLRAEHGWSQEQLGEVAGISNRTVQRIEKDGKGSPESFMAIASAFNVTPKELSAEYKTHIGSGKINWSGILGLSLCAFFIGLMIKLSGEGTLFFDCISLLLILGFSFALLVISCGIKPTIEALFLLRWFINEPKDAPLLQRHLPVLRKWIIYLYSSGVVSTLFGLVAVLTSPQTNHDNVYQATSVAFLTIIYATVIAEFIVRPLKNKLTHMLTVG